MSQPGYDPNQYPQTPQYPQQGYSPQYLRGQRYKEMSLVFGIVGLFMFGFVMGPLAIINANKAEAMGHQAPAGKILGWIAIIMWILMFVLMAGIYAFAAFATAEGWT